MIKRDFLSITDLTPLELLHIVAVSQKYKNLVKKTTYSDLLKSRTLAMIFEKPSLRTRVSFEVGMTQLGGHAIYLGPEDIGLGKRESVADIARVVSSMGDIIMARTFSHDAILQLAKYSAVPVINGL